MNKNALFEQIHITTKHTGKMAGMQSISTCVLCNSRCIERAKNPTFICAHCFAIKQLKRQKNNIPVFTKNSEILSGEILPAQALPTINAVYFRFEAFGDLLNTTHCINYFNICNKNPSTRFALWTKNPDFIAKAIADGYTKPANLIVVYSSPILNTANEKAATKYAFVDKIFTVFDKEHAGQVCINCGQKRCIDCLLCYNNNGVKRINETLK